MDSQKLYRARVSFAAQERYRIVDATGAECEAVPAGKLRWDAELPAVGDWVDARAAGPGLAQIEGVQPRRNVIARRQPGRAQHEQVLAANVDLIAVVMAMDRDFNLRRLERYLVLAAESGADRLIVLNKAELCTDVEAGLAAGAHVARGVPCLAMSAIESVEPLRQLIAERTVVLLGSSGVGKSTIVNALIGADRQATREVRETDSRGRHTTTHRMLIPLPRGGALIDTPGLRELALWAGQPALDEAFVDVAVLAEACRFGDCNHTGEPGCAVAAAIAEGRLAQERWRNYLKLQAEVRYLERSTDLIAGLEEKRRWKNIHKALRKHPKYRR